MDIIGNYNEKCNPEYIRDYHTVNGFHIENHYTGEVLNFLTELNDAMNKCDEFENFDKSEPMTDYFYVGWYTDIRIGEFSKPYLIK